MDSIAPQVLDRLDGQPGEAVRGTAVGQSFTTRILVPEIDRAARAYFSGIAGLERELKALPFRHFGLSVRFDAPYRLPAFDADLHLAPELRQAIDRFGVCIFSNVIMPLPPEKVFQKNIFPDLRFHTDRGPQFDNQVSLFYRNPSDPEHYPPRRTSTLVVPNAVFMLQAEREGLLDRAAARNLELFDPATVRGAIGKVMVEMPWDGPDGTGEVCLFDNRTVVHASYHDGEKHYPIAVQYLT